MRDEKCINIHARSINDLLQELSFERESNQTIIAAVLCSTDFTGDMRLDRIPHLIVPFDDSLGDLQFSEIEKLCTLYPHIGESFEKQYHGSESVFLPHHADSILTFVKDQVKAAASDDKELSLFFCCDWGQSRSTALAAAFLVWNGQDPAKIWGQRFLTPNPLVYCIMCETLGCSVSPEELSALHELNREVQNPQNYL